MVYLKMLFYLIALFSLTTLAELVLLIKIWQATSFTTTLVIVLMTGIIGGAMARNQGFRIWMRIQQELAQGALPGDSLIEGLIILVGGCLLVTPGVLTDLVGLMTLIPFTRRLIRDWLKKKFKNRIHLHTSFRGPANAQFPFGERQPDVHDTNDWQMK